ncbi:EAL domain-containing protein [Acidipila sp. EB88]|uniref:sensor domain-containing phosphodiesterase n=1 Tax=Acidipila sp. EB88 TaxID=2305226 RepID=UPI000F5F5FFE|nr:EAL domain-containing protein [Acidipila sp. EB88]RRA50496.1 EAL domain-containing protein [Acidipila sp. EB88]
MVIDGKSLLASLEQGEISPFYQPLRELRTGQLLGFELLARWNHPERGMVLPSEFIPVAEHAGLLTRLTKQILADAFQSVAVHPESFTLTVNISPRQLREGDIISQLQQLGKKHTFPLSRLVVEITETALTEDLDHVQAIALDLKALGCGIYLDGFGTGYSSFAHLQTIPFDGLKIDRSFIREIAQVRQDRKIVGALVGLGQSLGITTIAEGVETEEQASLLLYLGCDVVQGYFYGRPQPANHIRGFIDAVSPRVLPGAASQGTRLALSSLESLPVERVAQLQAIYDGAPVGLCYLSKDLRYISVNRRLSEIDGTPILTMIGQTVASVFPRWFPMYEPFLRRALQGEALHDCELIRPSLLEGEPDQCILFSCEPAKDEAQEVIGLSIAVLDITDRKRKEIMLMESEQRSRALLDLNPETPWVMDNQGNILDFGSRWEELTGFPREAVLNRGYLDTLSEEDRVRVLSLTEAALSTASSLEYECRARRADGTWAWIRVRGKAVLDDKGRVWRYYGSTEVIDELMKLREVVSTMNDGCGTASTQIV